MKIETAEYFNYPASELCDFYGYIYEWIDELIFTISIDNGNAEVQLYLEEAEKKFAELGWQGNGEINLIWIPPFALTNILKDGATTYEKKYGNELWIESTDDNNSISKKSATRGLLLWHVKQLEDGLSFLLSPLELNISEYILY